ncbi:MAG: hypothetical protein AAF557_12860 [Pseudomonadota bacterium]
MDVASYWKITKTYSKKLTGVDKMSAGFLSKGAGITDPLEKYVVAWTKANQSDYMKFGKKAYDNVEKYLKTILDKEIKDAQKKSKGKGGLSADELKSAKIIQSNLVLIRDELKEVLAGNKKPGNFKRDARDDVNTTLYTEEDKKRIKWKMELFNKLGKKAAGFKKDYKIQLGKVEALASNAANFAKDVKASFEKQDAETNKSALGNVGGISRIATRIGDAIAKHYNDNINGNDDWIEARVDTPGLSDMPSAVRKTHNDAYNKCDAVARDVLKLHDEIQKCAADINAMLNTAEGFSIAPPNPKDALKKLAKMLKDAESVRMSLKIANQSIMGRVQPMRERVNRPEPLEKRLSNQAALKTQNITAIKKCDEQIKSLTIMEKWLSGPASRVNDKAVQKLVGDVASKIKEANSFVSTYTKVRAEMLKTIKECDAMLAREQSGLAA